MRLVIPDAHEGLRAAIRKNLAERLPMLGKIDEIGKTPLPGIYEVRVGDELFYSDAEGNYFFHGNLYDIGQDICWGRNPASMQSG